jgi:hypothetical protein
VSADDTSRHSGARTPSQRLRWLLVVVAIMLLLTAGWPLVNATVADKQPVAADSRIVVGSGAGNSAVLTIGSGWSMLTEQSDLYQRYLLRRGVMKLSIVRVALVSTGEVPRLWNGLRQILSISTPDVRISRPVYVTGGAGLRAITGVLMSAHMTGTVTIFPSPSRKFAVEVVMLAPRGTSLLLRAAAVRIIRSLRFIAAHQ